MSDNEQTTPEIEVTQPETTQPEMKQPETPENDKDNKKINNKTKRKERRRKIIIAVIWVLLIIGIGFLILFLASRIGQFGSICDMLSFIADQF